MIKNKFFKFSLIYLILIAILGSFLLTFIFGVKVGVLRQEPYFNKIIELYTIANNFKKNLNNMFYKKNIQKISDENINENEISIDYGKIPEDIVIASSLSTWNNDNVYHYLVFLSEDNIIHKVKLDESKNLKKNDDLYKWPHGLIIDDQHIYYNFDGGNSLVKKDFCGNIIWEIEGNFHHLMSKNNNYLWVLKKENQGDYDTAERFVKINSLNGEEVFSFNTLDLIEANQPNDFFSIKQRDLSSIWEYEPFHYNDIDVLTDKFSSYFNEYSSGDLLISSRSLNSVFVVDPFNLKIKKFIFGLTRRQHDPDWNRGYITIYDNQTAWRLGKRYLKSRIVKMENLEQKKISSLNFDTSFESDARGNHDVLDLENGNIYYLILSPYEGKILLFYNNNKIFSFKNIQKGDVLSVSNGKILNKRKIINKINLCK